MKLLPGVFATCLCLLSSTTSFAENAQTPHQPNILCWLLMTWAMQTLAQWAVKSAHLTSIS